ncbi:helix-turn-helix domain-containing protein [Herbaspirillum sp. NPDC087042]|uniref:helix-turn-helix domain-containing protein n=1 Tax=Herbaspirillum sp. NPDC087042 TaxID=3364004 RepID=UPI00381DEE80
MTTKHPQPIPLMPHSGQRTRLLSSKPLGWSGFGAEMYRVAAGLHRIPAFAHHRVGVHVGRPVKAICRCDTARAVRVQAHGDADIVPAGMDGEWSDDADCTIFSVWFAEQFVRKTCEEMGLSSDAATIRPQLQWRDARFQHAAWALLAELEAEDASDALYAESLATAMVVRLAGAEVATDRKRRTLSARTAARVIDYIEANLDQNLSLTELATVAELSVPHFKVLFRETMGLPVHRHVVQRRLERARSLLVQGRLSMSQVALEAGFAHQSHMASWMRRLHGVTPRDIVLGRILPG